MDNEQICIEVIGLGTEDEPRGFSFRKSSLNRHPDVSDRKLIEIALRRAVDKIKLVRWDAYKEITEVLSGTVHGGIPKPNEEIPEELRPQPFTKKELRHRGLSSQPPKLPGVIYFFGTPMRSLPKPNDELKESIGRIAAKMNKATKAEIQEANRVVGRYVPKFKPDLNFGPLTASLMEGAESPSAPHWRSVRSDLIKTLDMLELILSGEPDMPSYKSDVNDAEELLEHLRTMYKL